MAVAHTLVNWVLGATWGGSVAALKYQGWRMERAP